jgi:hypothetical protein
MASNPPPIAEACGLATGLLLLIPKSPDSGVLNHESLSLTADANSVVALDRVLAFGFA